MCYWSKKLHFPIFKQVFKLSWQVEICCLFHINKNFWNVPWFIFLCVSCSQPLSWASSLCSARPISGFSCPLVSHWIWSMGGTSRRLEGGWNGVEYIWVCDSLPGGTQVSGGYIFLWWGIAPVRWSSPKATGFFFFFLTFGNTSSICPFIERVVSTSYCCRKSFVTCGFSSACHFFIYHPPSASHLFLAMTLTRTATQYLWSLWQLSDIDR